MHVWMDRYVLPGRFQLFHWFFSFFFKSNFLVNQIDIFNQTSFNQTI